LVEGVVEIAEKPFSMGLSEINNFVLKILFRHCFEKQLMV
jgi:hypothetical protein